MSLTLDFDGVFCVALQDYLQIPSPADLDCLYFCAYQSVVLVSTEVYVCSYDSVKLSLFAIGDDGWRVSCHPIREHTTTHQEFVFYGVFKKIVLHGNLKEIKTLEFFLELLY